MHLDQIGNSIQDFEAAVLLRSNPGRAFVSKDGFTLYMKIGGNAVAIKTGDNFGEMSDKEIEAYLHEKFKHKKYIKG